MPALVVEGLRKDYGKTQALKGVSLTVEDGEVFGFVGANGAGKTTFTKCVAGLLHPDDGRIAIAGHDLARSRSAALARVGIVPDQYELFPHLTSRQHLDYVGQIHGIPAGRRKQRVEEILRVVGMVENAEKKGREFSHGMKQRTCIGLGLLHKPSVLILDEPTNGLDPRGAFELRELIKSLSAQGCAIFLNSHVMSEVEQVCERIAIMHKGAILAQGSLSELRSKYTTGGLTRIDLQNPSAALLAAARKVLPAVRTVGRSILEVPAVGAQASGVIQAIVAAGGIIKNIETQGGGLEQAYLQLTGGP